MGEVVPKILSFCLGILRLSLDSCVHIVKRKARSLWNTQADIIFGSTLVAGSKQSNKVTFSFEAQVLWHWTFGKVAADIRAIFNARTATRQTVFWP
jgi:hypothetical protein